MNRDDAADKRPAFPTIVDELYEIEKITSNGSHLQVKYILILFTNSENICRYVIRKHNVHIYIRIEY